MEEIIKTYAGNIRRSRQNKKVTQAVMADKIGITEKYWSDIETGRKPWKSVFKKAVFKIKKYARIHAWVGKN